jgi:hypothetical protein
MKKPVTEFKETSTGVYQNYQTGLTREAQLRFEGYVMGALISSTDSEKVRRICENAIRGIREAV